MKVFVMAVVAGGALSPPCRQKKALNPALSVLPPRGSSLRSLSLRQSPTLRRKATSTRSAISNSALTQVVRQTCAASCHSDQRKFGSLTLEHFEVADAASSGANAEVAEKMINKLRTGMMPPPGRRRPGGDTLIVLASTLESIDRQGRRDQAGTRRSHVPATEPRRIRALDQAILDLDVERRRLAAARHQEREFRQHRRRADAVGDAARCLSRRGQRDQPARGR